MNQPEKSNPLDDILDYVLDFKEKNGSVPDLLVCENIPLEFKNEMFIVIDSKKIILIELGEKNHAKKIRYNYQN